MPCINSVCKHHKFRAKTTNWIYTNVGANCGDNDAFNVFILFFFIALKIPPLSLPMIRQGKPRFRKRDKLYYYATRLKRKFIDIPHDEGTSKAKAVQQQIMRQLTRRYVHHDIFLFADIFPLINIAYNI